MSKAFNPSILQTHNGTNRMKTLILTLIATAAATSLSLAQVGYWGDAGLSPPTGTVDVNPNYNNNSLETGDISFTSNSNVVIAGEDDEAALLGFEAFWP